MIGPGELAALVTALMWAFTAFFFGTAGRMVGSRQVNVIRLFGAVVILCAAMLIFGLDWSIPTAQASLLALSGLIGLVIGDAVYFECLVILGPRRGALLMTLAPVFTALLQLPLLNESLGPVALIGMAVTLAGVAWVVLERASVGEIQGSLRKGVVFGVLGALLQGLGIIVAKAGLGMSPVDGLLVQWFELPARVLEESQAIVGGVEIHAMYGTLWRMAPSLILLFAWRLLCRDNGQIWQALRHRRAMVYTFVGAFVGPFLGVWFSLYAAGHTTTAVAMTIISIQPVLVIPLVVFALKEKVSPRAVVGALIAIAGVGLLAFRDPLREALFGW